MRYVIIGDIHGNLEPLQKLLKEVKYSPEDTLISLGDIVDRGPDSVGVVKFLHGLSKTQKVILLRGNHEHKHIITWCFGQTLSNHEEIMETQRSLTEEERNWMFSSNLFFRVRAENLMCVHGGIPSSMTKLPWPSYNDNKGKTQIEAKKMMFLRTEGTSLWGEKYDGRFGFVFFGHEVFEEPKVFPHALGLDTGAGFGEKLSCAVFENGVHFTHSVKV